jgi:chemotaxis protein MotA
MKYIVGLFIATIGFVMASIHLQQGIAAYMDYVAFFVVLLGTFAVMLITFPAAPMSMLFKIFIKKFFGTSQSVKTHVERCSQTFVNRKFSGDNKFIEDNMLRDGLEMLSLGFSPERISEIMSLRFETYSRRINMLAAWLRRGAKYPPAFGLAGTVLGLIHLMRGISEGIDAKETGIRMAVALVATFYGLLISNLLLYPMGEWLQEEIKRDEIKSEVSLQTILLISTGANLVEANEVLSSFVEPGELRQTILSGGAPVEAT